MKRKMTYVANFDTYNIFITRASKSWKAFPVFPLLNLYIFYTYMEKILWNPRFNTFYILLCNKCIYNLKMLTLLLFIFYQNEMCCFFLSYGVFGEHSTKIVTVPPTPLLKKTIIYYPYILRTFKYLIPWLLVDVGNNFLWFLCSLFQVEKQNIPGRFCRTTSLGT